MTAPSRPARLARAVERPLRVGRPSPARPAEPATRERLQRGRRQRARVRARVKTRRRPAAGARAASRRRPCRRGSPTTPTSCRPLTPREARRRAPAPPALWAPSWMVSGPSRPPAFAREPRRGRGRAHRARGRARPRKASAAARATAKLRRWKAPRARSGQVLRRGVGADEPRAALGRDPLRHRPGLGAKGRHHERGVVAHDGQLLLGDVGDRRTEPARVLEPDPGEHLHADGITLVAS